MSTFGHSKNTNSIIGGALAMTHRRGDLLPAFCTQCHADRHRTWTQNTVLAFRFSYSIKQFSFKSYWKLLNGQTFCWTSNGGPALRCFSTQCCWKKFDRFVGQFKAPHEKQNYTNFVLVNFLKLSVEFFFCIVSQGPGSGYQWTNKISKSKRCAARLTNDVNWL